MGTTDAAPDQSATGNAGGPAPDNGPENGPGRTPGAAAAGAPTTGEPTTGARPQPRLAVVAGRAVDETAAEASREPRGGPRASGGTAEADAGTGPADRATAAPRRETPGRGAALRAGAARIAVAGGALWRRWRPLAPFLAATLGPVPLLLLAAFAGGVWSLAALLAMTAVLHTLDALALRRGIGLPDTRAGEMADRLSVVLAAVHFVLLLVAVRALAGAGGYGLFGWFATFLAFGLWFGQVSNSNAHELIHRSDRRLYQLGTAVYVSLLFGHHSSAHRLVHHRFVATTDDPNTATEGESFYQFAARAWPGALVAGYEMEEHRREAAAVNGARPTNPYLLYAAGSIAVSALMLGLYGFSGLLVYVLLSAHAQIQLLLSDYVQHYGLLRRMLPSGNPEPAGPQHSWDAPHPVSSLMMLNAPRHADHHAHPGRPFPELVLSPGGMAPLLPYSLPVMATIALVPGAWFRIMDPRLRGLRRSA
ncbi:MAG: alkane 1-monooxygenase [Defluviimonas sp.]|nr:alkane 1-monooxygenase [Paracoccaceae bacterium]MCC0065215.1 alkane 1-monooxygenase [Defluviimonas sp.]